VPHRHYSFVWILIGAFNAGIEKLQYFITELRIESWNLKSLTFVKRTVFLQYQNMPNYSNYKYLFCVSFWSILSFFMNIDPLHPRCVKNIPHFIQDHLSSYFVNFVPRRHIRCVAGRGGYTNQSSHHVGLVA
jgi:hypothetical protein